MLAHHSHNRGNEAIGRVGEWTIRRVDAVDLVDLVDSVDLVDDPPLIQTTSTPSTRPFAVSPHRPFALSPHRPFAPSPIRPIAHSPHRPIAHALSLTSHLAIATNSPTVHQFITKNVL